MQAGDKLPDVQLDELTEAGPTKVSGCSVCYLIHQLGCALLPAFPTPVHASQLGPALALHSPQVSLKELFAGKKGILFGVPGAYTPGCSKVRRDWVPGAPVPSSLASKQWAGCQCLP